MRSTTADLSLPEEEAREAVRLLVVEDDDAVAADLRDLLEINGYKVAAIVHSGEDAVAAMERSGEVDLVLMDIRLRGPLDGIEAAAAIRERVDVPVIFVTAHADPQTIERAKSVAPYGYLVKPFMSRELRSAIELALYKHRMESRLRQSERWLFTTLKSIGDALIATDEGGRVMLMNAEAERLTGFAEHDAHGRPIDEILRFASPEPEPRHPALAALRAGEPVGLNEESDVVHASGTRTPVSDRATPILDDSDNVVGVVVVFRDDTERRQTAAALRASEERYRTLFEQDVVANVVTTPEGRILTCNSAFVELFGFASTDEALRADATSRYDDPADRTAMMEILESQGTISGRELALRRVDGERVHVIAASSARRHADDSLREIHTHLIDITERKRLQAQLHQVERLRSIGQLAGGVAHDFNNLLTGILGYVEIARQEIGSRIDNHEDVQETLGVISELGERGALLVRQLLAFGRGDATPTGITDLLAIVRGQASILERVLGENITLTMELPRGPVRVHADPGQIQQVLMNLVLNARDALSTGGSITIRVRERDLAPEELPAHPELDAGAYVEMAVIDKGTGMREETLARVFEPFFTTKPAGKGTGLGLSIAYGIIRDHRGLIQAESVPGEGTEMRVLLPRPDAAEDPARARTARRPAGTTGATEGRETVLVVDDEHSVRTLIARVLDGLGYRVVTSASGEEALHVLADTDTPVDLIVTDLGMPSMDGRELLAAARERSPSLPAILISGHDLRAEHEEGPQGATRTLPKPFRPDELAGAVRELLDDV